MKYSFIVPAYNEARYIARCINSIRRAINHINTKPGTVEIIVVDNLSTDTTADICNYMGVRVIKCAGDNIAKVRNCGAAEATGDYLIFIDADSEMDYVLWNSIDWSCIAGGCLLKLDHSSWFGDWFVNKWNQYCLKNKIFTGCFCWIKKAYLKGVPPFNVELYLLEDIEFSNVINYSAGRAYLKTQLSHAYIKTSDRKLRLYSVFEHLKFWINFWWNKEKVIFNRKDCFLWYDGRRET